MSKTKTLTLTLTAVAAIMTASPQTARSSTFDKFVMASVACRHIKDSGNLVCVRNQMGDAAFRELFDAAVSCRAYDTAGQTTYLACLKRNLD